jgi:hypothetical protein
MPRVASEISISTATSRKTNGPSAAKDIVDNKIEAANVIVWMDLMMCLSNTGVGAFSEHAAR